jgi:glycosyltransferase involved in cell wall biosynthesis
VSGTLAYAAGNGRVIVSTPYSYAEEMLSHGRGLLVKFRDSESIADSIEYVLNHPKEKREMERKTYEIGKTMIWKYVAEQYKNLFVKVLKHYETVPVSDGNIPVSA